MAQDTRCKVQCKAQGIGYSVQHEKKIQGTRFRVQATRSKVKAITNMYRLPYPMFQATMYEVKYTRPRLQYEHRAQDTT